MMVDILLWGIVIGVIHFAVVGALYGNPWIDRMYQRAQELPGVNKWPRRSAYMIRQFLGTQVEVFILTAAYLYLRSLFPGPGTMGTALILGLFFAGIRVYPRFWNMWIQSTYPARLLAVEFVNGILSTFVIVVGLSLLPI